MNTPPRPRVAFAGLGAMGLPMAANLVRAGFDVIGFDVRPISEYGDFAAHMTDDPAALADGRDVLISVVRDIAETEALLFDAQGVMKSANPPQTLILSSTLSPRYIVDVAGRLGSGVTVIDAPMSGAPYRARDASLTFMLGGPEVAVSALMPLFQAMGQDCHYLGPTGAGAACKVANNLCAAAGVVAVRHALAAASAYGIAQDTLLEVMRSSSGSTWYGNHLTEIDWAKEGYDPANTIGILEKDVNSFVDALSGLEHIDSGPFEDGVLAALRKLEALP